MEPDKLWEQWVKDHRSEHERLSNCTADIENRLRANETSVTVLESRPSPRPVLTWPAAFVIVCGLAGLFWTIMKLVRG